MGHKIWEYKVIRLGLVNKWGVEKKDFLEEAEQYLTKFGLEGWELVSTAPLISNMGVIGSIIYYFKREILTEI